MNGWTDIWFIDRVVKSLIRNGHTINVGDAPSGVDANVKFVWAAQTDFIDLPDETVKTFEAFWNIAGRGAGHQRNQRMIDESDALVAIFAAGPRTPGTSDAVKCAEKKGIPVYIYHEGVWDVPEPNVLLGGANEPSTLTQRLSHGIM
jgi:hypothetical protein